RDAQHPQYGDGRHGRGTVPARGGRGERSGMNPERARFLGIALVAGGLLALLSTGPFFRMLPSLIWLLLLMLAGAGIWTARGLRLQQWQRLTLYALTGIYA